MDLAAVQVVLTVTVAQPLSTHSVTLTMELVPVSQGSRERSVTLVWVDIGTTRRLAVIVSSVTFVELCICMLRFESGPEL